MAKSKPRVRAKNRQNPTAKPVKPPTDPELAAIRETKILPVLQDLQSAELKTRAAAASAISNLIEDTKCRKLLLREQIVRILLQQTLTDSDLSTRTAGWGIVRNLALEEEADFCIHLYRQDILTAIEGAIKPIIQTIESPDTPLSQVPEPHQALLWTLTSSLITLLTALGEAQDDIVVAITKLSAVVNFLFGLLTVKLLPAELLVEVLSCLTALTEDNKMLAKQVAENDDWLTTLMMIKDSEELQAVPACGVLHNVFATMQWYDHNTPAEGVSDAMLIPVLVGFVEAADVAERMQSNGQSPGPSSPDQVLQLALDITASIATSLQEALAHGSKHEKTFEGFADDVVDGGDDEMTGLAADSDEEDLSEGDEEEDGGNHEMDDDEIDADMNLVLGDGPEDDDSKDDQVTLDRLVRMAAPAVLVALKSSSSTGNEVIQNSAFSALNNIAWTLATIDFSVDHLSSLQKFWFSFSQQVWDEIVTPVLASNTADVELATTVTSLAWAVSRSVQGKINIQAGEQRKFMALYQASKGLNGATETQVNGSKKALDDEDAFQSLGVKCIGVLGRLALEPATVELNREIGVFIITALSGLPETPAADTVQALDEIFDIYADKSSAFDEPVFWGDGFYTHLEAILPKSKQMAKKIDKRKLPELRIRADEAILNLNRFLRYKKAERASNGT